MKTKPKKCRECKKAFSPTNSLQIVCSLPCAVKRTKRIEGGRRKRAFNRETRKRKEAAKTRSDHLKDTQRAFNAYIRARDEDLGCISCDKTRSWHGQWHASHYRPQGNCSALRFHEMNVHKSCSSCNKYRSGNLTPYRTAIIEMYGEQLVQWMEGQNQPYKWDVSDILEIKAYYKQKLEETTHDYARKVSTGG